MRETGRRKLQLKKNNYRKEAGKHKKDTEKERKGKRYKHRDKFTHRGRKNKGRLILQFYRKVLKYE
jgi:hypothetical protein